MNDALKHLLSASHTDWIQECGRITFKDPTFTFYFARHDAFPPTWNVKVFKRYTALIKRHVGPGMSVVFVDDAGQIIDTIFSYTDFDIEPGKIPRLLRVGDGIE